MNQAINQLHPERFQTQKTLDLDQKEENELRGFSLSHGPANQTHWPACWAAGRRYIKNFGTFLIKRPPMAIGHIEANFVLMNSGEDRKRGELLIGHGIVKLLNSIFMKTISFSKTLVCSKKILFSYFRFIHILTIPSQLWSLVVRRLANRAATGVLPHIFPIPLLEMRPLANWCCPLLCQWLGRVAPNDGSATDLVG